MQDMGIWNYKTMGRQLICLCHRNDIISKCIFNDKRWHLRTLVCA